MEVHFERAARVIEITNKIRVVNRRIRASVAAGDDPDHGDTEELKVLTLSLEQFDNGTGPAYADTQDA